MTTRREHDRLRDPDDYPTESEIGDMQRQLKDDRREWQRGAA